MINWLLDGLILLSVAKTDSLKNVSTVTRVLCRQVQLGEDPQGRRRSGNPDRAYNWPRGKFYTFFSCIANYSNSHVVSYSSLRLLSIKLKL